MWTCGFVRWLSRIGRGVGRTWSGTLVSWWYPFVSVSIQRRSFRKVKAVLGFSERLSCHTQSLTRWFLVGVLLFPQRFDPVTSSIFSFQHPTYSLKSGVTSHSTRIYAQGPSVCFRSLKSCLQNRALWNTRTILCLCNSICTVRATCHLASKKAFSLFQSKRSTCSCWICHS